jgi:hypothetical protein
MILVDTDVMVDIMRRHSPAVAWLDSLGAEEVGIPGLVAMELLQGCRIRSAFHHPAQPEGFCQRCGGWRSMGLGLSSLWGFSSLCLWYHQPGGQREGCFPVVSINSAIAARKSTTPLKTPATLLT